jgi:23S rRNA (uracil1939-C5)-methyltransferase
MTAGLKKGKEIVVKIEDLAFGAQGIARVDDFVIFVDRAIPGQTVQVRIQKKKKKHAQARILRVLDPSPLEQEPECVHFGACGGCSLQHMVYDEQIAAKERQVTDALHRLGKLENFITEPILPSPDEFYYRNKMEFSFSRKRWLSPQEIESGVQGLQNNGLFLGLHAKGFYDKVIDVHDCKLLAPITNDIVEITRQFALESGLPAYSTQDHSGFYRFLIIRHCKNTSDLMVNLVTRNHDAGIAKTYRRLMLDRIPQITSLINSTTQSWASVAFSEEEYLLAGNSTILEKLDDLTYEISSNSFFQTNTKQAERLYDLVLEYAALNDQDNVYDLYCGAGSISLYVSGKAKKVIGFEAVEQAVQDAKRNSQHNDIHNCEFLAGDLRDLLSDTTKVIEQYGKPDVMIIDPPRSGMHPKTVQAILALAPTRIVHVSCNPTTLARDLALLCQEQYTLTRIRPVDMFPHTAHVEAVALLERI